MLFATEIELEMNGVKKIKKERKMFGLNQNVFMFGVISLPNYLSREIQLEHHQTIKRVYLTYYGTV